LLKSKITCAGIEESKVIIQIKDFIKIRVLVIYNVATPKTPSNTLPENSQGNKIGKAEAEDDRPVQEVKALPSRRQS